MGQSSANTGNVNGYKPSLNELELSRDYSYRLEQLGIGTSGDLAPNVRGHTAAVWLGSRFNIYHEAGVIAAIMPGRSVCEPSTEWFFGVLGEKMLSNSADPLVTIIEAAEYSTYGGSSFQRFSVAVDTLYDNLLPQKHFLK